MKPIVIPAGTSNGIREYKVQVGDREYQSSRMTGWLVWVNMPVNSHQGYGEGYLRKVSSQRIISILNSAVKAYSDGQKIAPETKGRIK